MELSFDWKSFERVYPSPQLPPADPSRVYLVVDEETVLAAYGGGEDFDEWVGQNWKEVIHQQKNRTCHLIPWDDVETTLIQPKSGQRYLDQLASLRKKLLPKKEVKQRGVQHFLVRSLSSLWMKLFPSSFVVLVGREFPERVEHEALIVQNGQLTGFLSPDFSNLGTHREPVLLDRVRSVSERFVSPVQGVFLPDSVWKAWASSPHPHRSMLLSLIRQEVQFTPFRWWIVPYLICRVITGR